MVKGVHRVIDFREQFLVRISKDEAPTSLPTAGVLFPGLFVSFSSSSSADFSHSPSSFLSLYSAVRFDHKSRKTCQLTESFSSLLKWQ